MALQATDESPHDPRRRVILQTPSVRVIAVGNQPSSLPEFKHKVPMDDILIEERRKNGMQKDYWHPVYHLSEYKDGQTAHERFAHKLFCEVAAGKAATDQLMALISDKAKGQGPTTITLPPRPRSERQIRLVSALEGVASSMSGELDARHHPDPERGLLPPPEVIRELHALFPQSGFAHPQRATDLVAALLRALAKELA